ncbi:hypothetical protein BT96DRAFT_981029 [Gymnopus androsaceus JB14]|uniref:Uncharacterized protein n=1 Tax=Gymnopus androsaceus JB14 TaxID=1447944 RepID=A0A6A4GS69_9AGAR|nr:hypothetical protein BT96DRAFT_981029 [Gymnopus androsaceus JB14]
MPGSGQHSVYNKCICIEKVHRVSIEAVMFLMMSMNALPCVYKAIGVCKFPSDVAPKDLQKAWVANPLQYQPMQSGSVSCPESAAGFFSILAEKQILQVEAFTFSVLFLLGKYSNFDYWWQHSIAPALSFHNYKLKDINPRNIHSRCLQLVKMTKEKLQTKIAELKLEDAPHGELRSNQYFQSEEQITKSLYKNHASEIKVIHINFRELEELEREFPGLKGGGVSRVNGDQKPVSCGAHTIYTPEQLHLECVYQDQAKVARCGKHVWVLTTGDPNKPRQPHDKVEMVIYNAWTQNVVEAFGNQVSMSGGTGDGLQAYKGIEATTTRGVDEIFNKAECGLFADAVQDSMAMQEVARYLDPDLFRDLEKMTTDSEKLGRLGGTLFTAHGYIALQHLESLHGEQKGNGMNLDLYILRWAIILQQRPICFWTFDAQLLHGTMLPSVNTVFRMRGGEDNDVSVSSGSHYAARKKDIKRASEHVAVENSRMERERYWNKDD